MHLACAVLSVLLLNGCLVHEARIEASLPPDAATGPQHGSVGTRVGDHAPAYAARGSLPFDIPSSWILRDNADRMLIGHARATSPLPLLQRFPCDLLVDLWPDEIIFEVTAVVTPIPVTVRSSDEITAEAQAFGYAP